MRHIFITLSFLILFTTLKAQSQSQSDFKGWHLKDLQKDKFYGISLDKSYDFLKDKKSTSVIVAVIDSGIDTTHEDLKPVLWKNPKEVPGNGIDDDKNGYVDDIYGWNFLGNKNGINLQKAADEKTRVYYRFKPKFAGKTIKLDSLSAEEQDQYKMWKKAAEGMNDNSEEQMDLMFVEVALKAIQKHNEVLTAEMNKKEFTLSELEKYEPTSAQARQSKLGFISAMKLLNFDIEEKNTFIINQLAEYIDSKKRAAQYKTQAPPDYRTEIIKDNYFDINDKFYGNSDVMGADATHGTHVSGIIAAKRGNKLGMDGVADNVKIMMLRAVPDGDEYDKDIALAIKYAVDNGAKVINMSFGKAFSPEKKWVDEAVRYAEMKDVLIVHAAGNESANVEEKDNFPNAELISFNTRAANFINVGASADPKVNNKMIADFSNYGKTKVDVFAPGVKIYSTMPGGNQYGFLQGTSMASPVVAGVAALIRSYYPQLSAKQVRYAIENSTMQVADAESLTKPGSIEKAAMSDLCKTGGFVNAAAAVSLAATLTPESSTPQKEKLKTSLKNTKVKQ